MSLNKPHSVLSFVYNTTIDPPYRAEMHTDMQITFARFEMTNTEIQASCYGVEQAAYRLRTSSDDADASGARDGRMHSAGKSQMASTTRQLFALLADELGSKILASKNGTILDKPVSLGRALDALAPASGNADAPWSPVAVTAKGVTVKPGALLLEYAYFFFHFPEARQAILGNPDLIGSVPGLANPRATLDQLALFDSVLDQSGKASDAALTAAVTAFSATLQQEYESLSWRRCW